MDVMRDIEHREERLCVGSSVTHKIFGVGIVEEVNEETKTYSVRFPEFHNVTKPISFEYQGFVTK